MYDDFVSVHPNTKMMNGSKDLSLADITITINNTFSQERFNLSDYDMIVIDEAHNLPQSIRDALCCSKCCRIIALTATPERLDWDTEALVSFF
jgi:superfamily II DNA or RNA helicase